MVGLVLLSLGCGVPADRAHAGLTAFEPASGAYRLWVLAPPWREADARPGPDEVRLEIASNAERFGGPGGAPPKYALAVDMTSGDPRALAQRVADRAPADARVVGPRPFATDLGVEGWETIVFDNAEGRFHRETFLPAAGRRVVQVTVEANVDLDDPEVDAMIASLEVGPFDPS